MHSAKEERARRQRIRASILEYYDVEAPAANASASAEAAADAKIDLEAPSQMGARATAASSSGTGVRADMSIDSQEFNVTKYTTALLKELTLPKLIEKDDYLRDQVKALDCELQDLVYSNYTKFIAAADTVRQVRSNVAEMDTKLKSLSENVTAMDRVSHDITHNLQEHRSKINEMLSVNVMLRKIQFLIHLPEAMQQAMKRRKFSTAVKCWVAGDAVFQKYGDIQSFRKTHIESRALAEQLYVTLSEEIANASLTIVSDATATLSTGHDDDDVRSMIESLRLLYATSISTKKLQAAGCVTAANRPTEEGAHIDVAEFDRAMSKALISSIHERFEASVSDFKARLGSEFQLRAQRFSSVVEEALQVANTTGDAAFKSADEAFRKLTLGPLFQMLRAACTSLRTETKRVYDQLGANMPKDMRQRALAELQPALLSVLDLSLSSLEQWLIEIVIPQTAAVAEKVLFGHQEKLDASAATAHTVADKVHGTITAAFDAVVATITDASKHLIAIGNETLGGQKNPQTGETTSAGNAPGFREMVSRGFVRIVSEVIAFFRRAQCGVDGEFSSRKLLVLSVEAKLFGRHAFRALVDDDVLPIAPQIQTAVRAAFDDATKALVHHSVGEYAIESATRMRKQHHSVDEAFAVADAPSKPSAWVVDVVSMWHKMGHFTRHVYATTSSSSQQHNRHASHASGTGSRTSGGGAASNAKQGSASGTNRSGESRQKMVLGSLLASYNRRGDHRGGGASGEVERLFARQPSAPLLRPSTFDAMHITECYIAMDLKAITEWAVRESREGFGRCGFQQMQVDTTFILIAVNGAASAASDDKSPDVWFRKPDRLVALVNELLSCVYDRCRERIPMPPAAVEAAARSK